MLNYIWGGMIIVGIAVGAINGNIPKVNQAFMTSSKEAVQLCIGMLGIICMWSGMLKIAEKSGLVDYLSDKMQPVIRFLFKTVPKDNPALKYISTNLIANILGLGMAATPAGLKAMEELQKLNSKKDTATHEMIMFLIINMSCLQLFSINIIGYRLQYGSKNPTEVILPTFLATSISMIVGIIFAKYMKKRGKI